MNVSVAAQVLSIYKIWKTASFIQVWSRYFCHIFKGLCEESFEDLQIKSNWKF